MPLKNLHKQTRVRLSPGLVWYFEPGAETGKAASIWNDAKEVRTIPAWHAEMLRACADESTIAEIAERAGTGIEQIIAELESWESSAPGTIETVEEADRTQRHTAAALEMFRRFDAERAGDTGQDLGKYHSKLITHAFEQFDAKETTVSHLFRKPHPALGGRSYGAAFHDAVMKEAGGKPRLNILEIGGGTGFFANEFLTRFRRISPEVYAQSSYCIADLSPELQRSQAELNATHSGILSCLTGDILQLPLAEAAFDLIICNEMIADLPVALIDVAAWRALQGTGESLEIIEKYGLKPRLNGPKCYFNVGAVRLVERISRLLCRGGFSVLTEYGSLDGAPIPVQLHQHREFSIQFNLLEAAAVKLGLTAGLGSLGEWLGFNSDYQIIHEQTLTCLAHRLLPQIGGPELERWAYDETMLKAALGEKFSYFGNLRQTTVADRNVLSPFKFFALRLKQRL